MQSGSRAIIPELLIEVNRRSHRNGVAAARCDQSADVYRHDIPGWERM